MELLFASAFSLLAFVGAIAVIAALGVSYAISLRIREHAVFVLFLLLVIGCCISVAFSGRDLSSLSSDITGGMLDAAPTGIRWPSRLITIAILMYCGVQILQSLVSSAGKKQRSELRLTTGFLIFYISQEVIPAALGSEPYAIHSQLYPLLVLLAILLAPKPSYQTFCHQAKVALLAFLAVSLAAALVKFDLVFQRGYPSWIPGFSFRFFGLATHANLIAPIALVLLLLEHACPSANRIHRVGFIAFGLLVLVIAQSKTVWLASVVAYAILTMRGLFLRLRMQKGNGWANTSIFDVLFVLTLFLVPALLAAGAISIDFASMTNKLANTMAGEKLASASGRTAIWQTAIAEWLRNPLFGFGPSAWDEYYRARHGLEGAAFHAHNQVLQSLSVGGLQAAIGMLIYVTLLARSCTKLSNVTNGVTLALFSTIVIRSFSEVPLPQHALFSSDLLLHGILIGLLLAAENSGLPRTPEPLGTHFGSLQSTKEH